MNSLLFDDDGHLLNFEDWSPQLAQQLADDLAVQLTDEHLAILQMVRRYYVDFGHAPTTRPLIKYLSNQLPDLMIDNQRLQSLFQTGLIARQLNRLAGLPKPANCL